jgi:hypothetical protein
MNKTNDTHKTNDTPKLGHGTFEDRTLDDIELDAVTGGASAASRDDLILNAVLAAAAKMLPPR